MRIAVGSLRNPKVNAVKAAMRKIAEMLDVSPATIEYISRDVESGIARTPISIDAMMQGAKNRTANLKTALDHEGVDADYYFGLEGGLFRATNTHLRDTYFLQSWVFVTDGKKGHFGGSPVVQIPQHITDRFESDFELADIMDRLAKIENNRDKGGAFSLLTKGLLTRQGIFEQAVLAAMAPFYNSILYADEHDVRRT